MGILLWAFLFAACAFGQSEIRLVQIASGLSLPTDIQNAGDGSNRLFFVQQSGLIRIFKDGALVQQPFLDIRNKTRVESERGLLGLAFPPGYAGKQRFYVNYTDLNGNTVVAMYRTTSNPDVADAGSEQILLRVTQPFANHNGGQVRFGPDGYLYIGMGDGGSGGDPQNNGQSRTALLGKMLRIDVESEPGTIRIPPSNPFVNDTSYRAEIWALGLRNPWRFSFDRATGDLWIADVGQNAWEEVNFQPASSRGGENYGWNIMEGTHCFRANCRSQGLMLPIWDFANPRDGCSVTGGFVYRGRMFSGLRGTYIYSDYCSNRIWGIRREGNQSTNRVLLQMNLSTTTFGEDEAGELYVGDQGSNGRIFRIEGSRAPVYTSGGVVNGASFVPGLVAGSVATAFVAGVLDDPGSIAAESIPLPRSLGGVTVSINGTQAPLYAVANRNGLEQVNFQVPFEAAGRATASIVITRAGVAGASVDVPVLDFQPGIFTSDSQAIVVHNADTTLVTNARPLERNEYAYFYAAGLGGVTNNPGTGNAGPISPLAETQSRVRVTVGGVEAEVQFAGIAPGLAGVYQINFRVPPGAPSGLVDIIASIGGASSPPAKAPIR